MGPSTNLPARSRPWWLFMRPRDIALFLRSARTDKRIAATRASSGARAAFEEAYSGDGDPWASNDSRYSYQRWKYQALLAAIPAGRRFDRALDLGCGAGTLSVALMGVAMEVLGLDIAQAAIDRAQRHARPGLHFAQGDIASLDPALDGSFDLVVLADTVYYLDALDDSTLKTLSARIARLLAPGGVCLLANHYFFSGDKDSQLTRRIHDAFAWSPSLQHLSTRRRPFYLTSILSRPEPS